VRHATDLDVTPKEIGELASADAITAFLARLGYETDDRAALSPEAVGLAGESASAIKRIELLSEDPEQFLRVVFAQPKALTAKVRNDLVRVLGRSNFDHLLVLASDFDTLEFVFLDKRKRQQKGPAGGERIQVVPKTINVSRRSPTRLDLRTLRRFTWTSHDALEQFDKLRSVFDAAAYTGEYFQNRGLFSDYFLRDRLRGDSAWGDNPSETFAFARDTLRDAQARWSGKDKETLRGQLLEPLFKKLGYKSTVNRPSKTQQTQPDYLLKSSDGGKLTAAFVYAWDRWLDGPDLNDADTPEENPGACVVTALDEGIADWIIVANGRLWRLYSRQAHARATNFYEVDLVEALSASGDTDPNEAFRYWWLFFRPDAFTRHAEAPGCWLDAILQGSREYAKRLGERLKDRIFLTIFPHLAQGFLVDRKHRLGHSQEPSDEELADIFEATLTLLYRLLFLLYAESRDLLAGAADVVVCDGFTGNIALKLLEGTITSVLDALRSEIQSTARGKLGGLLIRPAARRLRARLDPDTYGGAYLLGLRGLAVIAHGNSSRQAIANAIRLAARGVEHDVVDRLAQRVPERVLASARSEAPGK